MDNSLKVSVSRTINAPAAEVFKAWVDPEIMMQWYSPIGMTIPKATSDPKTSGEYSLIMAAGDQEFTCSGKYLEVDEPNKLVFTWDDETRL